MTLSPSALRHRYFWDLSGRAAIFVTLAGGLGTFIAEADTIVVLNDPAKPDRHEPDLHEVRAATELPFRTPAQAKKTQEDVELTRGGRADNRLASAHLRTG